MEVLILVVAPRYEAGVVELDGVFLVWQRQARHRLRQPLADEGSAFKVGIVGYLVLQAHQQRMFRGHLAVHIVEGHQRNLTRAAPERLEQETVLLLPQLVSGPQGELRGKGRLLGRGEKGGGKRLGHIVLHSPPQHALCRSKQLGGRLHRERTAHLWSILHKRSRDVEGSEVLGNGIVGNGVMVVDVVGEASEGLTEFDELGILAVKLFLLYARKFHSGNSCPPHKTRQQGP